MENNFRKVNSYTMDDEEGEWGEDKRVMIDNLLTNTDNPRIINYKLYKFPVEDPIDMRVTCNVSSRELKLKTYHYPAYNDV